MHGRARVARVARVLRASARCDTKEAVGALHVVAHLVVSGLRPLSVSHGRLESTSVLARPVSGRLRPLPEEPIEGLGEGPSTRGALLLHLGPLCGRNSGRLESEIMGQGRQPGLNLQPSPALDALYHSLLDVGRGVSL